MINSLKWKRYSLKDRVFSHYWAKHEVGEWWYYCWEINNPALPFEHGETFRISTKLKYKHATKH